MTPREVANTAASVHQRLLNMARASSRPFNELLQHFAIERFLYRLSNTGHADQFVLKGALMLSVWGRGTSRPTMDIDLLGRIDNNLGGITDAVKDACQGPGHADVEQIAQQPLGVRVVIGLRSPFQPLLRRATVAAPKQ